MSRKRIKKDVVKRNVNMYDPMGIYGRGLTKNQKLGMTRQMKVEYMSPPPIRITRSLLDEYKKTLQFYGVRTGYNTVDLQIPYTMSAGTDITLTFDADTIKGLVDSSGYNYMGYSVDSLVIQKASPEDKFPSSFFYRFYHFDQSWDITLGSTSSTVSFDMKSYVLECPVKVGTYWIALYKPLKDGNNTDWIISYEYQQTNGATVADSNQIAIGESMPFALYPEQNYNTSGTMGRKVQIIYSAVKDFILKFNVRLIC